MSEVSGTSEVPDQHIARRVGKRIFVFLQSRLPGEKTKRDIVQYDRLIGNLPEEPKAIAEAIRPVVRAGMYAGNCVGTAFEGMVVLSFGVGAVAFIREGHRRGYGEVIGSIYRPDLSRPGQTIVRNFFDAIGGKRGKSVVDRSGVPAILELEEVLRRTKAPDDWVMLSAAFLLMVAGLTSLFSTTSGETVQFSRQIIWIVLALGIFAAMSAFDYRVFRAHFSPVLVKPISTL